MSSINLKRHLTEDELDLSLQDLETVPVKKIADLRKVASLDLSCNLLAELPEDFGSLARLVRLDLSKNRLSTLPSSFGDLVNLQHLDLRDNRIAVLPPCFGRLRRLRWLDLKNNPLEAALREVAGDCVNKDDCLRCAQQVVPYMRQVAARLQQERQERLERERQLAAAERQRELEEKRLAKEERRRAYQRRLAEVEERRAAEADDEGGDEEDGGAGDQARPASDGDTDLFSAGGGASRPAGPGLVSWAALVALAALSLAVLTAVVLLQKTG